jgi:predicted O-methyltransferase YrrM
LRRCSARGTWASHELGTSYGYSTLWLADAARATGGKVVSLELSQRKVDHAQAQLTRAGLADFVEFRIGSGVELSRKHEQEPRP